MQKAEATLVGLRQCVPVCPCLLQQLESTVDIGTNKIVGRADGTVNVALGSEMNDCARPVPLKKFPYRIPVRNIAPNQLVTRISRNGVEITQVARVGQLVQVNDRRALGAQPLKNEI